MPFNKQKFEFLIQSIKEICKNCERNFAEIQLLAATKYANGEEINNAIKAGVLVIGENKIQDAQKKMPQLLPVKKHFIGHLQRNKVRTATELFDCIESVDSLELAANINDKAKILAKIMPIFIEVNVANDPKKFGVLPETVLPLLERIAAFEFVKVTGLMTIVPFYENVEEARPFFRKMSDLFFVCKKQFPALVHLSMGMSHDYRVAIEEGATEIRIGSYLFS